MTRLIFRVVLILFLSSALFQARSLFADGFVFPTVKATIAIPDQRAIIHYEKGTECLVIETNFQGPGQDFAWVIPFPTVPEIDKVSLGLFPTTQHIFRDQVTHYPFDYITYLLITIFIGSVLSIILIPYYAFFRRKYTLFLLLPVIIFVLIIAVPSLFRSRGGGTEPSASVSIHERKIIGAFETTTISSKDPDSLLSWLRNKGYDVPDSATPIIEQYVRQGWVFAAIRLRMEREADSINTPHPLAFTFKTKQPVYPIKLTGMSKSECRVELYIFGPKRAEADFFKVIRCEKPEYPVLKGEIKTLTSLPPHFRIWHPSLRAVAKNANVATKLMAELTPEQMVKDVFIEWVPFKKKKRRVFSPEACGTIAFYISLIMLVIVIPIMYIFTIPARLRSYLLSFPFVVFLAVFLILPKIDVTYHRQARSFLHPHNLAWSDILEPASKASETLTEADLRKRLKEYFSQFEDPLYAHPLGGQIREEDSPGNYMIRTVEGKIQYVIFDHEGTAILYWQSDLNEMPLKITS